MTDQETTAAQQVPEIFVRKLVDVYENFRDTLARHLVDGRVADKEKLEKDKLKMGATLVNFLVAGGIILFSASGEKEGGPGSSQSGEPGGTGAGEQKGAAGEDGVMSEAALFSLLKNSILLMLAELNKPEVNLLKVSMSKVFRLRMQEIFAQISADAPDRFPVKIFNDVHPHGNSYMGINMRNHRSLGEDIDRIERDPALIDDIAGQRRPIRHTDSNLHKIFIHS